ncbi:hypothetical protein Vretimale_9792 [Volvox reticuliferus]|uniref:Protein kinase domain-containing protein n=1 Tax=Volvox reticuliferus TaxID=1737510 RepID=A0A8J4GDE5_9CHLO|nr:hypothetical protein Vretifemale_13576 [Volvox reticuliferus]GIM05325.1 hypothetical protein Vretimale_9792 [Volvox reticuliferus]
MSSKHSHIHGSSRDRDFDRRSEYGRDGRDKRDDRGSHHQHRSQREPDVDRLRGEQDRLARSKPGHHSRPIGHESQSPHRDRAGGYHTNATPSKSKGSTPGPKGNSVLAELLRTAKAKQQQEQGGLGLGASTLPGSASDSEGELLEAGEILPPPPPIPASGSAPGAAGADGSGGGGAAATGAAKRRYHSPIIWNLDGPGPAGRTVGGGGGGVDGGRPPPPKRLAPTSALDRAAEELAVFRRQQAEAEAMLGYDPDGPPAVKSSPSASESEDDGGRGRGGWSGPGGGSVERIDGDGGRGRGRHDSDADYQEQDRDRGRSIDPMEVEEEHEAEAMYEELGGRPRGGSRWLDAEAKAEPRLHSGGGGSGPDGVEAQDDREVGRRGAPSPSPRPTFSAGGEPVSGRDGGGGAVAGGRGSSESRSSDKEETAPPGDGRGGATAGGRSGGGDDGGGMFSGDGEEALISPQIASLAECRSVDEYERLNRVSEGTYGVVFRARCKRTGRICALKKIKMEKERDGFPVTSIREINILLNLHHPNIVNVSEVVMGSRLDQIFMVMEFMDHDLKSLMNDKSQMTRPFSVAEVKCLMMQLLSGIEYLHENWVIHRDLKTSNILYNNRGELKICDFGLARQFGSPLRAYTQPVVTLWYRPPELLLGEALYSTAVDMWSVGCIMAELLTGKPLFDGQGEIEQLDKICAVLGTPNEEVWPGLKKLPNWGKIVLRPQPSQLRQRFTSSFGSGATLTEAGFDLLSRLLSYDPQQRISAAEALDHRWFTESPFPQRRELMPTFRSNKDGSGPVRQAAMGAPGSPPLHFMAAALKAR